MPTTLVRNGTLVTATDRYDADVYVDGGVVALIGRGLSLPADTVVDASGKLVLPGGVDVHTHLDLPVGDFASADDFESGTVAAAFGGTTTVVDFATQDHGEGLLPPLARWKARAEGKAVVDYGFHMAVVEWSNAVADDMDRLARREGVPSFKLYMAYPGRLMVDDFALLAALRRARESGALVMVHAENGAAIDALQREAQRAGHTAPRFHAQTRPPRAEAEATARACALAELTETPVYVVHMTCAEALDELSRARARGVRALGETCPQYLVLSSDEYERPDAEAARFVMSPPLRPRPHHDALWRGLAHGDLAVVATDHCPFRTEHKALGLGDFTRIPNGGPGIETRLMLLWDAGVRAGRIDPQRFVALTATNPARVFGLWPRKGTIAVGSDADLVVWDPDREVSLDVSALHSRLDYSNYEGRVVRGAPVVVVSRGEVIVDHDELRATPGRGRFLPRHGFAAPV